MLFAHQSIVGETEGLHDLGRFPVLSLDSSTDFLFGFKSVLVLSDGITL